MAQILETITELQIVSGDFTLLTAYSGETNPNVTFDVVFTVLSNLIALEGASITIGTNVYYTDANGQATISLNRGDYEAVVSLTGYGDQDASFTILDQNIVQNIEMVEIGSFGNSYDDSYQK